MKPITITLRPDQFTNEVPTESGIYMIMSRFGDLETHYFSQVLGQWTIRGFIRGEPTNRTLLQHGYKFGPRIELKVEG